MRVNVFLGVLIALVLLMSCLSVLPAQADSTWNIQTLDQNSETGTPLIALDSNNNPHIAYTDFEGGDYRGDMDVMYANWNGSGWGIQTVVQYSELRGFALDSLGNPHIVYFDDKVGGIVYASWTGSNWITQPVDRQGTSGSLALDSVDNPHIAYCDSDGALKYASWTGSNWSIQTVDQSMKYYGSQLLLDLNDNPRILYSPNLMYLSDIDSFTVNYAVWNGSSWNIQTVFSNVDGGYGNMVLDSSGYPHFLYQQNNTLAYASWDGAAWISQSVISSTNVEYSCYLALDSRDFPRIDYYYSTPNEDWGTLIYARWTGSEWSSQNVSTYIMDSGPIVIDSNDNPHIVFSDSSPKQVGSIFTVSSCTYATLPQNSDIFNLDLTNIAIVAFVIAAAVVVVAFMLWHKKSVQRKIKSGSEL